MNKYLKHDDWKIIEEDFNPKNQKSSESLFSIGNGHMGQRANFEEYYSGDSFQGSYIAGVYYPDKTKVGWWKNGYPEYFAKVLNSTNWIGIDININGIALDLAQCKLYDFSRVLNMKEGTLSREFKAELPNGNLIKASVIRFVSMKDEEVGAIKYDVTPLNFNGRISFVPYLDADIENEDSNYEEKFWDEVEAKNGDREAFITVKTKKLDFHVCSGMKYEIITNNENIEFKDEPIREIKYVANVFETDCEKDKTISIIKYVANVSSLNYQKSDLMRKANEVVTCAQTKGFDQLLKEHIAVWAEIWKNSDITIEGDTAAQQAIRYNIFQLNQTYTGKDPRLNIGPKGFTGEKYGGSTYWDTEAYCLPFYLSTADPKIARNLLIYRHNQLGRAIENAEKLGFTKGAALYPMVTMNGEECHNEWEITFEEIHRNGAIAYAIYNYVNYTGDKDYLAEFGLDVLVGITRFWAQRVNWSSAKNKYVMLGVTGPNEYENNVNNNWYTNLIACWCMKYTKESLEYVKQTNIERYNEIVANLHLNIEEETTQWQHIVDNMYFPVDEETGVFMQQDNFMDKDQTLVKDLDPAQRPINQHWSWDRILRSCYIKQADVLQGIYLFEEDFDFETIKRNYDFYEPRTVHESSLSPCVHSILAAKIGDIERAYEFYLRTSRLDLDDYNAEAHEGCHITSMAGTWMSITQGFGGMRVLNGELYFNPLIPKKWKSYAFKVLFKESLLNVKVKNDTIEVMNESNQPISIHINNNKIDIQENQKVII